ncbi:MAG: hypothetical protein IPL10_11385 [Bacteroidetes bacterium]|nr:hypothetical protein [Bacteroidota bacterium]
MTRIIIILFLAFHCNVVFSQLDTIVEPNAKEKNTRRECWRDSLSSGQVSPTKCKYYIGKKKVTEQEYEDYLKFPDPSSKCTPCYLINKVKGKITYEGDFYTDCGIGVYIERYNNGKIKVKGYHKTPLDQNYTKLFDRGYCSVRIGEWFYYKENGELEKTIVYNDGIEIKK